MDSQHQSLVELVNTLIRLHGEGLDKASTSLIVAELTNYVLTHFRTEESFMEEHGYEGLAEHRATHQAFEYKVAQWNDAFDQGDEDILEEILGFLSTWLVDHIGGSDRIMVHEIMSNLG